MFNTFVSMKVEIPIQHIKPNPDQPRKKFGEESLQELADSIKEYGIIQPVLVRDAGDEEFMLIAGERRYKAAELAGCDTIPAIIMEVDDKDAETISLVENIQRESLNYLDEAKAYRRLIEVHGLTQDYIASKVGKKQSTISNKVRLLHFPGEIQSMLIEKGLSERHARALLKLEDTALLKEMIEKIAENNLNVTQTEKLVSTLLKECDDSEQGTPNRIAHIHYKIYLNTLRRAFGTIYEAENNARYFQEDRGEYLEVKILIPKNGKEIRQASQRLSDLNVTAFENLTDERHVAMPNIGIL